MPGIAQNKSETDSENAFDFWVGDWEVSWQTADGKTITARNTIEKTLDGKVLQENFVDANSGFKGTSISVFNPKDNTWHQAWADNQGGYFDFIGETEKHKRIFKTHPQKDGNKTIIKRMVFKDITAETFTWDWELSDDAGQTWTLQWRIHYKRLAQ